MAGGAAPSTALGARRVALRSGRHVVAVAARGETRPGMLPGTDAERNAGLQKKVARFLYY